MQRERVARRALGALADDRHAGARARSARPRSCRARRGSARSARGRRAAAASAAARPAACATLSVPGRSARSCPPPKSTGSSVARPRPQSRPAPFGPPSLWPATAAVTAPGSAPMSTSSAGTGLHGVEVQRHAALGADRGGLGDRLDDARQVAGPDQAADEVARPHGLVERARRARARRRRPASVTTSQPLPLERLHRAADRGVLERRRRRCARRRASRARRSRCCRPPRPRP